MGLALQGSSNTSFIVDCSIESFKLELAIPRCSGKSFRTDHFTSTPNVQFEALRRPRIEMSNSTKYLLISLPTSISPSNDRDEALTALRSTITNDCGTVTPFKIPDFKIGTLDALVQQADDLAKLESTCEAIVAKVGDSLRTILEGDEAKIAQQKTVNDSEVHIDTCELRTNCLRLHRARRSIPSNIHLE